MTVSDIRQIERKTFTTEDTESHRGEQGTEALNTIGTRAHCIPLWRSFVYLCVLCGKGFRVFGNYPRIFAASFA